jgi:hypothetical protein
LEIVVPISQHSLPHLRNVKKVNAAILEQDVLLLRF